MVAGIGDPVCSGSGGLPSRCPIRSRWVRQPAWSGVLSGGSRPCAIWQLVISSSVPPILLPPFSNDASATKITTFSRATLPPPNGASGPARLTCQRRLLSPPEDSIGCEGPPAFRLLRLRRICYTCVYSPVGDEAATARRKVISCFATIVLRLLLLARSAEAGGNAYCVGGFEAEPGGFVSRRACAAYALHRRWHFHAHVCARPRRPVSGECWDRLDDTCETTFLRQRPGVPKHQFYTCQRSGAAHTSRYQFERENRLQLSVAHRPALHRVAVAFHPGAAPPGGGSYPLPARGQYGPPSSGQSKRRDCAGQHGAVGARDSVRVTALATTSSGTARAAQGERSSCAVRMERTDSESVRPQPNGQVVAMVKLPENIVGNLQLGLCLAAFALQVDETMGTVSGKQQHSFHLSSCRLRGHILLPASGEVVIPQSLIPLSGELRDKTGQPVSASTLSRQTKAVSSLNMAMEGFRSTTERWMQTADQQEACG